MWSVYLSVGLVHDDDVRVWWWCVMYKPYWKREGGVNKQEEGQDDVN